MIVTKNPASWEYCKKIWWGLPRTIIYIIFYSALVAFTLLAVMIEVMVLVFTGEGAIDLILSVLLMAYWIYSIVRICYLSPRKIYENSLKVSPNVVETICFNENSFTAENIGDRLSERVEYTYDRVTKAYYKNGWFLIYCDKTRGYAIHNGSFVQGDPQQLTAFLTNKLGTRFKVK